MACDLVVIACDMQDLVFDDDAIRMMRMVIAETQQQSPFVKLFDEAGPHQVFSSIADYFAGCKRVAKKISVVRNKKRKLLPVSLSGTADIYRL